MRKPDVFISFDIYDHEKEKDQFINDSVQSSTPFNIKGWSQPASTNFFRDSEIIKSCNILIALVGKYSSQSENVVREIRIANGNNVPVLGVYLSGVNDRVTEPPAALHRTRMTRLVDGWDLIGQKVALCLKEQKNIHEAWGSPGDDLPPLPQTQPAMTGDPLEQSSLKTLEDYLIFEQKRDRSHYVSDENVCAAARQLGRMRSQAAIRPLVKCIMASSMFDTGAALVNALVAIGRPALETLERARITGRMDDFQLHPGGTARGFLLQAIDRIKGGYDSHIKDDQGMDIHGPPIHD